MKRLISGRNLISVVSQSGGYLSSGYKLNKNVVNFKLKKSKYMNGFNKKSKSHSGGAVRSGSEVRNYNGTQDGGAVRSGSEVRNYNGTQDGGAVRSGSEVRNYNGTQDGGAVRSGSEVRTYYGGQSIKQSGGTKRHLKNSNINKQSNTKVKKRKSSRK
jgi:hypothetical protein